jgi:hypothetical protein
MSQRKGEYKGFTRIKAVHLPTVRILVAIAEHGKVAPHSL